MNKVNAIPCTVAEADGNSFVIVETEAIGSSYGKEQLKQFAIDICAKYGVDGLQTVTHAIDGTTNTNLRNSDGSYAELSGNGTRCVAAYIAQKKPNLKQIALATDAGEIFLEKIESRGRSFKFKTEMPEPALPMGLTPQSISFKGAEYVGVVVDVGNPQFAIFVDTFSFNWQAVGRQIEQHYMFEPGGTNVSFSRVTDPSGIESKFWERGAGATKSSGTGSAGAAVASLVLGLTKNPVTVAGEGGTQVVSYDEKCHLEGWVTLRI